MKPGAEPGTEKRCNLLSKFSEMDLSYSTRVTLTESMDGQTESRKEEIAEQLLTIISTSSTEKEMLEKAAQIKV